MEEQLLLGTPLLKMLLLEDERSDWVNPIIHYQPFASNIKKRKQGIDMLSPKLHDTLAYTTGKKQNDLVLTVSLRNMSVHVSAARRH